MSIGPVFKGLYKNEANRIAGIYFLIGSAWILFSDSILGELGRQLDHVVWFSMAKGLGFILFTTFLLHRLIWGAWRRQAQLRSAIQDRERFLQDVLRASPAVCYRLRHQDGMMMLDWVSENGATVFGYEPGELKHNEDWMALMHPDDKPRVEQALEHLMLGRRFCQEYRVRHKDGHYLWVYDELCASGMQGGEPYFVGAVLNITEQRQAQERLRLSSAVIDTIQNGVVITDAQGNIEFVNPAFSAITGYSEADVRGHNPRLLNSGHHDDGFFQRMWRALESEGSWNGEIMNRRKNGELYLEWLSISRLLDNEGRVNHYIGTFSDISRLRNSEKRVSELETLDPVSQLPNRHVLLQHLAAAMEDAIKNNTRLAVLCINIIDFKRVNENFGHGTGDSVIRKVARRISQRMRTQDCVSRTTGDKFMLYLDNASTTDAIETVTTHLLELTRRPIRLPQGSEIYLDVSIGISLFPGDGVEAEMLMRNAEVASHHAKLKGRNCAGYYSADMSTAASRKWELENRLRNALQQQEFVLHYQPVVNVASGKLEGAEALVRWQPPGQPMVSPADFIPLAEETGMIVPLGEWVVRQAAAQLREWRAQGLDVGVVAVNLSARQIAQTDLAPTLANIIRSQNIPAACIELEITESSLMNDAEQALFTLNALRAIGCPIAIDDFGTGYSSLSYLKRFPIDKLKIDRSFIKDLQEPKNSEIVHAIISMAKALKLVVQAEGVEQTAQLNVLQQLQCELYQGYLFSKPVPAEAFAELVRAGVKENRLMADRH